MKIFSNVLRNFTLQVSRRESCKLTSRRYSSQLCSLSRVRSFATKSESSENARSVDSSEKQSANIIPVAFLKTNSLNDPFKILVVPIDLFSGDSEAIEKVISTVSALRNHAEEIDAFTDNSTVLSDGQNVPHGKHTETTASQNMQDADLDISNNFYELKEAISEFESFNPYSNTMNWASDTRHSLLEDVTKTFDGGVIATLGLDLKDDLMSNTELSAVEMERASDSDAVNADATNNSSKSSIEKLVEIEISQFNDYVTTVASKLISRMYSTKCSDSPIRSQSPHMVSTETTYFGQYVPAEQSNNHYLLSRTLIDDLSDRGLMCCQAYLDQCKGDIEKSAVNELFAAPDSDPPCKKLPFKCPSPKKKKKEETVVDDDPCRTMYPPKCPPTTSKGDCKAPIYDPCKEQNKCIPEPKKVDVSKLPCDTGDPCKKDKKEPCKKENPCKKSK